MVNKTKVIKSLINILISMICGLAAAYVAHKLFLPLIEDIFNNKSMLLYQFSILIVNYILPVIAFVYGAGLVHGTIHNKWINEKEE